MTDIVTFGETTLRLAAPPGQRLEEAATFDAGVSGPESNVAAVASNLGADSVWLSRLPESPLGRRVVRYLRSHGVRTGVSWADRRGAIGTQYVEAGGEPRGRSSVVARANSAFAGIDTDDIPTGVVRDADCFHVTGVTPGLSGGAAEATAGLLETAAAAGTTTAFALRYRERLWSREEAREQAEALFPNVDVLFATLVEARKVLGEEGDPVEIAHGLRTTHGFETVVLSRKDGSALAAHGDEVHDEPAVPGETVDPSGIEEAFIGGYLTQRADGGSVSDALSWGTALAALTRTLVGDGVTVSRSEVERIADRDDEH